MQIFKALSDQRHADIRSDRLFAERVTVGAHASRGNRPYMEDRHTVVSDFDQLLRSLARVCPHDTGGEELPCDCYGTKTTAEVRKCAEAMARNWSSRNASVGGNGEALPAEDVPFVPVGEEPEVAPQADSAFHLPLTYVAVFDGHTGAETAEFCTQHLHRNIAAAHIMGGDLCEAITKG